MGMCKNSDETFLRQRRKRQDIIVPAQLYPGDNKAPQDLLVIGSLSPVKLSYDDDSHTQVTSLVKQGALQGLPSSSPFANYTASGGFSRHRDMWFPRLTLYRRLLIDL